MDSLTNRLIADIKQGDEQAFAELVDLYKDKVYQVAYRMVGHVHEAQDIAQEAFLRAYTNLDKFDTTRKFSTWLFRITTNVSIDRLRKRKPDMHLQDAVKGMEEVTYESQLAATDERLKTRL